MITSSRRLALVLTCCTVFLAASTYAQQPYAAQPAAAPAGVGGKALSIDKIDGKKAQTPEYQVTKGGFKARTRDWFQIVTSYTTKPDWVDEVSFKYYVLVKNKDPNAKGPKQALFAGDVTYINVQAGKHKSDMYIHPSTLTRYGDVQAVAVVVSVQGKIEAIESSPPSTQRWWEQLTPMDGMLLNRMQTPFAMLYFDDFEAVKPPTK